MPGEGRAGEPCELLDWDSSFFGFTIARTTESRLDDHRIEQAESWCAERGVRCLYLLADAGDPGTALLAQERGFRVVDVRLTLERPLAQVPSPTMPVKAASREEIESLLPLARESFGDSRFFADPGFPRERVRELYAEWLLASDGGPMGDIVLIAEHDGRPAGAITCAHRTEAAEIGLVLVDPAARGAGIGLALVAAALAWAREGGSERTLVPTQARNVGAQRLYQRAGFVTARADVWLHRWFE